MRIPEKELMRLAPEIHAMMLRKEAASRAAWKTPKQVRRLFVLHFSCPAIPPPRKHSFGAVALSRFRVHANNSPKRECEALERWYADKVGPEPVPARPPAVF
jgi:hypothetical protein